MNPFHPYQLTETIADQSDRDYIAQQIRAFNNQRSPHHLHVRSHPPAPLDLFLRDESGSIVGGLTASTYWGWLDIDNLWVHEDLRQRGFGAHLLRRAEEIARQRGCTTAFLTTFGFQARGFYEKYGYVVVGELTDYPPGSSYFWLRKNFE